MTDKASPAGWVVQVTNRASIAPASQERWIGPKVSDAPSFQYYNVAFSNPHKAVEATASYVANGKTDAADIVANTVRALSSAEVAALGLGAGEAKPA